MVSDADMDGLAELSGQARERTDWLGFARFCDLRGKGLRAEAFKSLSQFLAQATSWPFEARLQFTRWLLDRWRPGLNLPQPLHAHLVVPTVREWIKNDPHEASAHLWLGLLGCDNPTLHVERALELDPHLDSARKTLVQWILADIDYNQHEMPSLYIHDPREDLKSLERAESLVREGGSQEWVEGMRQEIPHLRRQAEEWLAAHPREGDFASH
jgi:hypothetical protein